MFRNQKITLGGSSHRRDNNSKRKIVYFVLFVLFVFLSIWQMPIKQSLVSTNIDLPTPKEEIR